ncbi:MAG: polysaccharide deacetylase family protein, partial [Selenomonadaceae bacterium]|nr:polysaccharide deacetylase family protein [Selenomonadaceae bacterium]
MHIGGTPCPGTFDDPAGNHSLPGEENGLPTFDDGPDEKNTPAILDILKKEQAKATFYVLGRSAQTYPDVVRRIFEEGHAIGNHSYDHEYGKLYASTGNYLAELEQTDDVLRNLIGVRPLITRAPGGRMGNFTAA